MITTCNLRRIVIISTSINRGIKGQVQCVSIGDGKIGPINGKITWIVDTIITNSPQDQGVTIWNYIPNGNPCSIRARRDIIIEYGNGKCYRISWISCRGANRFCQLQIGQAVNGDCDRITLVRTDSVRNCPLKLIGSNICADNICRWVRIIDKRCGSRSRKLRPGPRTHCWCCCT